MNKKVIVLTGSTASYIYRFRWILIKRLMDCNYEVVILSPLDRYVPKLVAMGCNHLPLRLNGTGVNPFNELISLIDLIRRYKQINPYLILQFGPKIILLQVLNL